MYEIFLNPINYLIKESDNAIVIAKNLDEAERVNIYLYKYYANNKYN